MQSRMSQKNKNLENLNYIRFEFFRVKINQFQFETFNEKNIF